MTRRIGIMFIVALFIAPLSLVVYLKARPYLAPQPSNEAFIQVITRKFPDFIEEKKPVVAISSVSRHGGRWYIITIRSLHQTTTTIPVRLLLVQSNGVLEVVSNPETHFTESQLITLNVPKSVKLELLP